MFPEIAELMRLPLSNSYIIIPFFAFSIYGFLQIITEIINRIASNKLHALAKAEVEGDALFGDSVKVLDILDEKRWIEKYKEWNAKTTILVNKISKTDGEQFNMENKLYETGERVSPYASTYSNERKRLIEKLARIEQLIRRLKNIR